VKGSAFEFFLGHRGLNDDLAQYFTPRNIIRFMCNLIEPKPGEKIYDPFCGSGGILINAFEYIKKQINPDDKISLKNLKENTIYGTDINSIAYVAKMNMILVGDGHANITEQKGGSLINKRTNQYDIVMTNIPFNLNIMDFGNNVNNLYDIFSNNGNSICVQHCLDALSKNLSSRACIIIPEQFIFHECLKDTRKYIINNYDIKIFSLPQGVFEPYTNAKTCILYLNYKGDKGNLEFININHVGFSLNKNKNKISQNDLIEYVKKQDSYENNSKFQYEEIEKNNFSFKIYPETTNKGVILSEILEFSRIPIKLEKDKNYFEITIKIRGKGIQKRSFKGKNAEIKYKKGKDFGSTRYIIQNEDFIFSTIDARNGCFSKITEEVRNGVYTGTYCCFKLKKQYQWLNLDFLTKILNTPVMIDYFEQISRGTSNRRSVKKDIFLKTRIPFSEKEIFEYNKYFEKKQIKLKEIQNQYQKIENEINQKFNNLSIQNN
jgi:type I restriction enzyme M protein